MERHRQRTVRRRRWRVPVGQRSRPAGSRAVCRQRDRAKQAGPCRDRCKLCAEPRVAHRRNSAGGVSGELGRRQHGTHLQGGARRQHRRAGVPDHGELDALQPPRARIHGHRSRCGSDLQIPALRQRPLWQHCGGKHRVSRGRIEHAQLVRARRHQLSTSHVLAARRVVGPDRLRLGGLRRRHRRQ